MERVTVKRALFSVYDKSALNVLVPHLLDWNIELIASGGTQKYLESLGLNVTPIESITQTPVTFSGRVKTLSFQIAAALLFNRESEVDQYEAKTLNIEPIDLVICNLHPFSEKIKAHTSLRSMVEHIDIGGQTLIRSAAKNFHSVCVCTDPNDYPAVASALNLQGALPYDIRYKLAKKAFAYTARYESEINEYFNESDQPLSVYQYRHALAQSDPPQSVASIISQTPTLPNTLRPIQGPALTYTQLQDLQTALYAMQQSYHVTDLPSITLVKSGQLLAANTAPDLQLALQLTTRLSNVTLSDAILASSHPLDLMHAYFFEKQSVALIAAPEFTERACNYFKNKKQAILIRLDWQDLQAPMLYHSLLNCLLAQNTLNNLCSKDLFKNTTSIPLPDNFISLAKFGTALFAYLKHHAALIVGQSNNCFQLLGAAVEQAGHSDPITQVIRQVQETIKINFSKTILISTHSYLTQANILSAFECGIRTIIQFGTDPYQESGILDTCNRFGIVRLFTNITYR